MSKRVTIQDIVKEWLTENSYEGLCNDDCGCEVADLMPCDQPNPYLCEAGYKIPCPGPEDCKADGDCPWHISPNKSSKRKLK